jgi:4-hydroxybenzoate polyprenyltransferase
MPVRLVHCLCELLQRADLMQPGREDEAAAERDLLSWIAAMRPRHWIKNLLVFVPGFFAQLPVHDLFSARSLWGFVLICLASSAGYLLNDALDKDVDKLHPVKRHRPVPSGRIIRRSVVIAGIGLATVCLAASFVVIDATWMTFMAGYILLSALYSFRLKQTAWLDVAIIATLFVLRLYAGGELHQVSVSGWLLLYSILFFSGLALCKRLDELQALGQFSPSKASLRRGYKPSDLGKVEWMAGVLGAGAALVLIGYLMVGQTAHSAYSQPRIMAIGIIATSAWYFRIWHFARLGRLSGDPVIFALLDRTCIALAVATLVSFVAAR